jgi:prolyl 4-hydroxylase
LVGVFKIWPGRYLLRADLPLSALTIYCSEAVLFSSLLLAVKPKKGDALLFFNLHVNATADTGSLHGSCPVIEGEKWSATKWIHVRSFDNPPDVRTDAPCSDDKELCPRWAAIGECHRNPTYMVGTKDTLGFCRKSCGICDA